MMYGIKANVDHMLMDMQSQKFPLKLKTKEGKEESVYVQGSVRLLPLGIYEYVFPKESLDLVLNTLNFDNRAYPQYKHINKFLAILRKILKLKKNKKTETDQAFLWFKEWVSVIPIGIREDVDMIDPYNGSTHEAL